MHLCCRMLLISSQPTLPQGQRLLCFEWLMYFPTNEVQFDWPINNDCEFFQYFLEFLWNVSSQLASWPYKSTKFYFLLLELFLPPHVKHRNRKPTRHVVLFGNLSLTSYGTLRLKSRNDFHFNLSCLQAKYAFFYVVNLNVPTGSFSVQILL